MSLAKEVLAHFHLPLLSCVGLLLFMGVFIGALFWVFRGGSREFYAALSDLPLEARPGIPGSSFPGSTNLNEDGERGV